MTIIKKRKKPPIILILSMLYFLMPIVTLIYIYGMNFDSIGYFLNSISIFFLLRIFHPIIASIAILSINLKGLYVTIAYAILLMLYNLMSFFTGHTVFHPIIIYKLIITFLTILILTSKDIYYPYKSIEKRGFRKTLRRTIELYAYFNDIKKNIKNINEFGAYIKYQDCPIQNEIEIPMQITINNTKYTLQSKVKRVEKNGFAVTFLDNKPRKRLEFRKDLQKTEIKKN